jgi:hypothetical protein
VDSALTAVLVALLDEPAEVSGRPEFHRFRLCSSWAGRSSFFNSLRIEETAPLLRPAVSGESGSDFSLARALFLVSLRFTGAGAPHSDTRVRRNVDNFSPSIAARVLPCPVSLIPARVLRIGGAGNAARVLPCLMSPIAARVRRI